MQRTACTHAARGARALATACGRRHSYINRTLYVVRNFNNINNNCISRYVNTRALSSGTTPRQPSSVAAVFDRAADVVRVTSDGNVVAEAAPIWLRDHCRCSRCLDMATGQKVHNSAALASPKSVDSITPVHVGITKKDKLTIEWKDGMTSEYNLSWLTTHCYTTPLTLAKGSLVPPEVLTPRLWPAMPAPTTNDNNTGTDWRSLFPPVSYNEVLSSEEAVRSWLLNVYRDGLGFVDGCPPTTEATERLADRIGTIRETHFGRFWVLEPDAKHGDSAYSSDALPAHTDTTYFTDPIAIQLFHVHRHSGTGGLSLYVDGFRVAEQLRDQDPEAFHLLSSVKVTAHCVGDGDTRVSPSQPFTVLRVDPSTKEVVQVRYNNADRSGLYARGGRPLEHSEVRSYYRALEIWEQLLTLPENQLWVRNVPGVPVAVDNWRVLHGRSAFTGQRALCGSYHSRDDVLSRISVLSLSLETSSYEVRSSPE